MGSLPGPRRPHRQPDRQPGGGRPGSRSPGGRTRYRAAALLAPRGREACRRSGLRPVVPRQSPPGAQGARGISAAKRIPATAGTARILPRKAIPLVPAPHRFTAPDRHPGQSARHRPSRARKPERQGARAPPSVRRRQGASATAPPPVRHRPCAHQPRRLRRHTACPAERRSARRGGQTSVPAVSRTAESRGRPERGRRRPLSGFPAATDPCRRSAAPRSRVSPQPAP
jgi:hypothetical protein